MARTDIDLMEYANDAAAQAAYVPSATGADDVYTKLLLHCDGADASTTFTDEAGKTVTVVNQAQIDTAQSKFGGASGLFDGANDCLTIPQGADFNIGSGDFTIDFWVRFNAMQTTGFFYYKQANNSDYHGVGIIMLSGILYYAASSNGTSWDILLCDTSTQDKGSHTLTTGAWYHIALTRSGNDWKGFVNGELDWSKTVAGTVITSDDKFQIAAWVSYAGSLNGWIDEFRFTKGLARWTSAFTPPTLPYRPIMDYSEGTIKAEGTYSLKTIAKVTTSLNKTLTRTVSPTVDLSNKDYIGIYMRASRTGANIKIGFHDSGGTTTEITPTINVADTWELKVLDMSAVTNANKDVIDSIIITITNADADNTFYIDCVFSDTFTNNLKQYRRVRVPGAITG